MSFRRIVYSLFLLVTIVGLSYSGEFYLITSSDGNTSYKLRFGSGKAGGSSLNGFDPVTKKLVVIHLKPGEAKPKPVAKIWDHKTGKTIPLYKFPDVEQPLPVIESIKDLTFFPFTDSKDFEVKKGFFD